MRFSFTGGQVGCTMKTSRPRTFSMISTLISPSLKRPTRDAAEREAQVERDVARQSGVSLAGENRRRDGVQRRGSW